MTEQTGATQTNQSRASVRRRVLGLVALFVGLMGVSAVATVVVKGRDMMAGAQVSIQDELSKRLPGATIVGELGLDGFNRAVFRRVRVEFSPKGGLAAPAHPPPGSVGADRKQSAHLPSVTLEIDELIIRFSTVDLFMNRKRPTEAIQSVTAIRPVLTVRAGADGSWPWDVQDGASRKPVELTELAGAQVKVVDGRVVVVDRRTPAAPWVASAIQAQAGIPAGGRSLTVTSLRAQLLDGSVQVGGKVAVGQELGLDLEILGKGLLVRDLVRSGRIPTAGKALENGRLSIEGRLHGRTDRLGADGRLSFQPAAAANSSPLDAMTARFAWTGQRVELTDVTWPGAGGRVTGQLTADHLGTSAPSLQAQLSLHDVDASALQGFVPAGLRIGGRVSGTLTGGGRLFGTGTDEGEGRPKLPASQGLSASGTVTWTKPIVNGVAGETATARLAYGGGELHVADVFLQLDGMTMKGSGKLLRDGRVEGTFTAPDISLSKLARISERARAPQLSPLAPSSAFAAVSADGRFQVSGTVSGSLRQLQASAQFVSLGAVQVGGVPFNQASGLVRFAAPSTLSVEKLSLVRSGSAFHVVGTVGLRSPHVSRLQMRWQNVPVDMLAKMISDGRNWRSGETSLETSAIASIRTPTSGEAPPKLVDADTEPFLGRIESVGLLPLWNDRNQGGTWRKTLSPQDAWSAQRNPLTSAIPQANGSIPRRDGGRDGSPGGQADRRGPAEGRGGASRFEASLPRLAGRTTGEITLSGSLLDPAIRGSLSLSDGAWLNQAGARIQRGGRALPGLVGEIAFNMSKGVARIGFAEIRQGGGRVKLSGWVEPTPHGAVAVRADGESLDVGALLAPWWRQVSIDGQGILQADLTGTWDTPQLKVVWNMGAGQVDQVNVDGMRLSAIANPEVANIQELVVYRGVHRAEVRGRLPIPRTVGQYGTGKAKLDLTIEVPDGPLDLVGAMVPGLSVAKGRGEIRARVTGTVDEPLITGEARISGATVANAGLPGELSGLDALIRFSGRDMAVVAATARYGGGTVRMGGTGSLGRSGVMGSKLDLTLSIQDVQADVASLTGQASGSLRVGGTLGSPLVQGKIHLANGQYVLGKPPGRPVRWQARLDVQIQSQGDLRILGPGIEVVAGGQIHAGGTLSSPELSGRVDAVRGRFDYLGTEFRLSRGLAEFTELRGAIPTLTVDARASVPGATVILSLTGPADDLRQALRSEPEMPESEIMARLGYPNRVTRFAERPSGRAAEYELVSFLSGALQGQLLGRLEDAVQELLSVDELQIHSDAGLTPVKVEVGKYLQENLYMTYTNEMLGERSRQDLGVELRVTPEWRLKASVDDGGGVQLGVQAEWRF